MNPHINTISNRLSLRPPQRQSVEILARICEIIELSKDADSAVALASITHSWKSYTAKQANQVLGRHGSFWQKEYFDRAMEDAHDMARTKTYIEANPVAAGICQTPADWRWSSARPAAVRTADILSAQAGGTPAVQPRTKAQRRRESAAREPSLFEPKEAGA